MSLHHTPSGGRTRSLRRGALAVTAAVLSTAALTACGAGNNAQSLGVKPDTAAVTVDTISVQNANVIVQPKADSEGPAAVSATVFNNGRKAQTIDSITLPGAGRVQLKPAKGSGPITVPAEGSVIIGGKGNASAFIENGRDLTKNIGGVQETVFRFSDTGDVKLKAFVMASTGDFKDFGPTAPPKPAPPKPKPSEPAGEPGSDPSGTPENAENAENAANADDGANAENATNPGNGENSTEQGTEGQPGAEGEQSDQANEQAQSEQGQDGEQGQGDHEGESSDSAHS
ncbi:DUF461 domain-containing protein [Streptomyces sp. NPDC059076]|uniref:DUF461 domain-containing protein n=1 Tax=unclassified Streptomyces TaxID=2593676 RepID=UPI003692B556